MSDPYVQEIGRLIDPDGRELIIGTDHDTVTIGNRDGVAFYLGCIEADEFAQLFNAACWQAGQNSARMTAAEPPAHDCREAVFTGMAIEGHDCRDALFAGKD